MNYKSIMGRDSIFAPEITTAQAGHVTPAPKKVNASENSEIARLKEEYSDDMTFARLHHESFSLAVQDIIRTKDISCKAFVERTLLSERFYERINADKVQNPNLQTVMQICMGLDLGWFLSESLLYLASIALSPRQTAYKKVLLSFRGHDIYECDEALTALGMPSIIPNHAA